MGKQSISFSMQMSSGASKLVSESTETYKELFKYVPYAETKYDELFKQEGDVEPHLVFNGYFEKEVCYQFGDWFARYVSNNNGIPSETEAKTTLDILVSNYVQNKVITA